jgi:hypothetical protein
MTVKIGPITIDIRMPIYGEDMCGTFHTAAIVKNYEELVEKLKWLDRYESA